MRTLVTATVLDVDGNRLAPPLFLDTGGFDGRQARTRRHIDRLKSKGRPGTLESAALHQTRLKSLPDRPYVPPVARELRQLNKLDNKVQA